MNLHKKVVLVKEKLKRNSRLIGELEKTPFVSLSLANQMIDEIIKEATK